jgi:hypothetical protein
MSIHTFLNDQERANWAKVADKDVNDLLQELRLNDTNIYVSERVSEIRRWFRKPLIIKRYEMYIDSNYDAQIINFCPESGRSSINTSVTKQLMITYMLGILHGYNKQKSR